MWPNTLGEKGESSRSYQFDMLNNGPPKTSTSLFLERVAMLPYMGKEGLYAWLGFLRWGVHSGWSGWAHCNDKGPYKKETERLRWEREAMTMGAEVGVCALNMEEGATANQWR